MGGGGLQPPALRCCCNHLPQISSPFLFLSRQLSSQTNPRWRPLPSSLSPPTSLTLVPPSSHRLSSLPSPSQTNPTTDPSSPQPPCPIQASSHPTHLNQSPWQPSPSQQPHRPVKNEKKNRIPRTEPRLEGNNRLIFLCVLCGCFLFCRSSEYSRR